ncbi:hypothetical protein [Streptomyces sp. V1I1]|uniref:hypothetical protein n=1 Tax=Streptomyces sp. V1I1 TaxID=3042272 RepID=UPI002780EB49|nr:hypothetical protein [Streptomyces sp. V1I1]MDQ0941470.1 hypothetical protein [Streptomyces sp. V1I1]
MRDRIARTLDWVTLVLFGPQGRHRAQVPQAAAQAPAQLNPAVCGARLVAARRHRARRAPDVPTLPEPRAQWFPPAPWERPLTLVRPYVLVSLGEEWRHAASGKGA